MAPHGQPVLREVEAGHEDYVCEAPEGRCEILHENGYAVLDSMEQSINSQDRDDFTIVWSRDDILNNDEADDGVPSVEAATEIVKAMTRPDLMHYCATILAHPHMSSSSYQVTFDNYTLGLHIPDACSQGWEDLSASISAMTRYIMKNLRRVPEHTQRCFSSPINRILGCENWLINETQVVDEFQEYEISAVLWLLKIGPRGLASSLVQDRPAAEYALSVEQEYLASDENIDEDGLKVFATELKRWGHELETSDAEKDTI